MKKVSPRQIAWILLCLLSATACRADPVSAVQLLRMSGCGGVVPAAAPLHANVELERAAALWAGGATLGAAAQISGYHATAVLGLHLRGPDDSILQSMRRTRCRQWSGQSLRDMGVYRLGPDTWMLLAAPGAEASVTPIRTQASATQVLQLVNDVRARGGRCGDRSFAPSAPLLRSPRLDEIAAGHAADMARHDYFEHVDLNGNTPADRVRAAGYREKLVGENIAYGPGTAAEVVAGWLHSTGHCENIMDPRFVEMGLAAVPGQGARRGLYWDQMLAEPLL